MPLSPERINSIRNTVSQRENPIDNLQQNVTSAVKDPFGQVITKTFFKVNSLVSNIEKKLDQLLQEVAKSTDSKGRVAIEGSTIVITITKEDVDQALEIKRRVETKVNSVRSTISTLEVTLKTLQSVQTAMTTLQTALNIQELILSVNPTTGPIFTVLKKSIKLIFLKDIITEYTKFIKGELRSNLNKLSSLSEKFKNINVDIKISDEKNKGNEISKEEAERMLIQDLLNSSSDNPENTVDKVTDVYESPRGKRYILVVEKEGENSLIGRAYEEQSGLLEEQTAPSFMLTPQDLLDELKFILNTK